MFISFQYFDDLSDAFANAMHSAQKSPSVGPIDTDIEDFQAAYRGL